VNTEWNTSDIWIRRAFDLPETALKNPELLLHHDDDVEVYINGVLAFKAGGYLSAYDSFPITAEAAATLKPGKNTFAIHCHQKSGGQFIDAGLTETK
jgi:hypothetical protein